MPITEEQMRKILETIPDPLGYVWATNVSPERREEIVRDYNRRFSCEARLGKELPVGAERYTPSSQFAEPQSDHICGVYIPVRAWILGTVEENKGMYDSDSSEMVISFMLRPRDELLRDCLEYK